MLDRVVPVAPKLGIATPSGLGFFNPFTDNFAILPEDWEDPVQHGDEEDRLDRFLGALETDGPALEAFQ